MCAKRKTRKAAGSDSGSRSTGSSLDQLAKKLMPKWRIVNENSFAEDAPREVDAVSPDLIKKKESFAIRSGRKVRQTLQRSKGKTQKKLSGLVNMAPTSEEDARLGAKTQVIEDDEHTASQG
jgi:hypothetical protein